MIVCAGESESFDFALPIGVGLIEASVNLTRLALFDKPDFLLFVGTAGSYGEHNIFDVVESKSASNIELGFLSGDAYTPINNVISANNTKSKDIIVNSSNYITTNSELSKKFLKLGLSIENMEFFALMHVAKEFDIPAGGIFCITNYTDKDAHETFLKNHAKAKEILKDAVAKKIEELKSR